MRYHYLIIVSQPSVWKNNTTNCQGSRTMGSLPVHITSGSKTGKAFWRAKDVHNLNPAILLSVTQRNSCDLGNTHKNVSNSTVVKRKNVQSKCQPRRV